MAFFNYPFHISKDTPAVAAQVQTNFDELLAWVLDNALQKDGTNASTGPITLPPGPPASPEQAANKAYVDAVMPIGVMMEYAGTTLPSKWLWCDGQTYTNTAQPALSGAIGRTYTAAAIPANSFQVPDLRGKFAMGAGPSDALGKGSAATAAAGQRNSELFKHLHSVPAHGHTASSTAVNTDHAHTLSGTATDGGAHAHGWDAKAFLYNDAGESGYGLTTSGGIRSAVWSGAPNHTHPVTGGTAGINGTSYPNAVSHSHTITVVNKVAFDTVEAGAGTTLIDKNLPPYIALNYIIYAGA